MEDPRLFCTFRVDGGLFGVDILDVREVTTETTYTRIAHAPDEVLGLVNIRGHIFLVLDLRRLLGMPESTVTGNSRLVLFKPSVGSAFGVVVDEIADIQTVELDRIEAYSRNDRDIVVTNVRHVDLIDAVCKLNDELIVVLNPRRFLPVIEQHLTARA